MEYEISVPTPAESTHASVSYVQRHPHDMAVYVTTDLKEGGNAGAGVVMLGWGRLGEWVIDIKYV